MTTSTKNKILTANQLSKKIGDHLAINSIDFTAHYNEKIAILGVNGSGKSTFLKLLCGLEQPDQGLVFFEGEKVKGPFDQLIPGHKKIAYLSQHFELFNNYYIKDILSYKNELDEAQTDQIFTICNIRYLLNRKSNQLSGGEKQRIALAKQLLSNPSILLLDEPYSNMDMIHKHEIKRMIDDISNKLNITTIMVTHDATEALTWADRICIMKDGVIVQDGEPFEVYYHPTNEYCGALLGEYDILPAAVFYNLIQQTTEFDTVNKYIFLRSSSFKISALADNSIIAKVKKTYFKGTHLLLQLSINSLEIHISTDLLDIQVNDIIHISCHTNQHWLIDL